LPPHISDFNNLTILLTTVTISWIFCYSKNGQPTISHDLNYYDFTALCLKQRIGGQNMSFNPKDIMHPPLLPPFL